MAIQKFLSGRPKKQRVRDVRSHLWHYRIRPKEKPWPAAWSWAIGIANSYDYPHCLKATEIATQYLVLLLVEMNQNRSLRLPHRASKVVPSRSSSNVPEQSGSIADS